MKAREFAKIRRYLGKTQDELAHLLGVSPKAIQSFEQGWRTVSVHCERHLLFLLLLRNPPADGYDPCWIVQDCPAETQRACPGREFEAGHLCWFINGTICHGRAQKSWEEKMQLCRQCEVFVSLFPLLRDQ